MNRWWIAIAALAFAAAAHAQTPARQPPTISALAATPMLRDPTLSPSGRYLSLIVSEENADQLVVFDLEAGNASAPAVTVRRDDPALKKMWIDWAAFKSDERLVFSITEAIYFRDGEPTRSRTGGRDYEEVRIPRVWSSNRQGGELKQMFEGQQSRLAVGWAPVGLQDMLPNDPQNVLLTAFGAAGLSLYRGNVDTGRVERIDNGNWNTEGWHVDGEGTPVLRLDVLARGSGYRIFRRPPGEAQWIRHLEIRKGADAKLPDFVPLGPGPGRGQVYVLARPETAERAAVYLFDATTGALGESLFHHPSVDAEGGFVDRDRRLRIACAQSRRLQCKGVDEGSETSMRALQRLFGDDHDVTVVSSSQRNAKWVVLADSPENPGSLYVFDRAKGDIVPIGPLYDKLQNALLAPTEILSYTARDGAQLWGYLTRLPGAGPRPTVVMPHGGPERRDSYGYDPLVQLFASRGYAVFQPQFRGSGGFGRTFANAGHGQWGLRMQDDVTDGVEDIVAKGIADGARVCIVGASYGGYAALAGAALTPDLYKCAVSIAGDTDLDLLLEIERRESGRGSMAYEYWLSSVGDPRRDAAALRAASPRLQAARITAPVLLLHGEEDGTVDIKQSEVMEAALRAVGKSVRFIRFPHAGHPFSNWTLEDRERLYTELEAFVATHLGPAPR